MILLLLATATSNPISPSQSSTPARRRYHVKDIKSLNIKNGSVEGVLSASSSHLPRKQETECKNVNKHRNLLFLCSLVYGSSYIITKRIQEVLSSEMINFIRFLVASICFLPKVIQQWSSISREIVCIGIELGLWCGLGFTFQTLSLQHTAASKAALFTSLGVVIPPIIDYLVSIFYSTKETSTTVGNSRKNLFYLCRSSPFFSPLLAVIGAAIIEWGGMEIPKFSDLLLLITPFSFAMTFWRAERVAVKFPNHTSVITALMLSTTTIISGILAQRKGNFPITIAQARSLFMSLSSGDGWKLSLLLLFLGAIATGWTAICEQQALKVLSSKETVLIYATEPIFAAIFAALILKEQITTNFLFGAAFILAASISR